MCGQCGYILRLHLRAHNNYRHCVTKEHMTLSEATSQGQTHPAKPRDECSKLHRGPHDVMSIVARKKNNPNIRIFKNYRASYTIQFSMDTKKLQRIAKKRHSRTQGIFFFGTTELKETAKCQGICNQNAASREAHSKSFRGRKVGLCFL